tara:strand:- start:145 stop:336 length:192 start_codon:yes stop_codon:yes gene_type:complete
MNTNKMIIECINERLEIGAKKYDRPNILFDRDYEQEAFEEILDCMVYCATRIIELKRLRRDNG